MYVYVFVYMYVYVFVYMYQNKPTKSIFRSNRLSLYQ
jgi:hypothetical protein